MKFLLVSAAAIFNILTFQATTVAATISYSTNERFAVEIARNKIDGNGELKLGSTLYLRYNTEVCSIEGKVGKQNMGGCNCLGTDNCVGTSTTTTTLTTSPPTGYINHVYMFIDPKDGTSDSVTMNKLCLGTDCRNNFYKGGSYISGARQINAKQLYKVTKYTSGAGTPCYKIVSVGGREAYNNYIADMNLGGSSSRQRSLQLRGSIGSNSTVVDDADTTELGGELEN